MSDCHLQFFAVKALVIDPMLASQQLRKTPKRTNLKEETFIRAQAKVKWIHGFGPEAGLAECNGSEGVRQRMPPRMEYRKQGDREKSHVQ